MAVFLGLLIGGKLFGLMGIILTIPAIAIAKIFLKFLRELYQSSTFYNSDGAAPPVDQPKLEERIAEAADAVLAEQELKEGSSPPDSQSGEPPEKQSDEARKP